MKKIIFCTAALSLMLAGSAYASPPQDKHKDKLTGLENALERGNKNETAREAIRRALERKEGRTWTDEERVNADLSRLRITYSGSDSEDSVTQSLGLPVAGARGSEITWESSNPAIVSDDGLTVNRPAAGSGDAAVTLTATVTSGDVTKTKTFTLTVKALNTEAQRVAADLAALAIGYKTGDSASSVTQPVTLPSAGANGSAITWVSSNPSILSSDGLTLNRPAIGSGDTAVTLTATATYGGVSDTKTFTLTIKPLYTDAQRVAEDKTNLGITLSGSDTASSITQPLTLPVTGASGSTITWVSSNAAVISNDGKTVNRPAAGAGDATVTLTAIITYGSTSDTKTFTVTVKQQLTDSQKVAADKAALAVGFSGSDTYTSVTQALTFPSSGVNGSSVTWISGNPSVVSSDGKTIVRPAAGSGDANVTLTAIISYAGYSDTKTFTVTVKQQLTDAQKVAADKDALAITYASGDSAGQVTANLTLPTVGPNGSTVTWVSSNTAAVSSTGVVNRPASGSANVAVNLTAVITSGGYAETKNFVVTVKALP